MLKGRVGAASAAELTAAVADSLSRPNPLIVIDFELVDYISSAGLRVIQEAAAASTGRSGALVLAALCEPLRIVLELGGVLEALQVEPTRTSAIERAQKFAKIESS